MYLPGSISLGELRWIHTDENGRAVVPISETSKSSSGGRSVVRELGWGRMGQFASI